MVTRAKNMGINPEKMAKKVKKVIAKQRETLAAAVQPYADVDGGVYSALEKLLYAFDDFTTAMDESTEWLNQEVGT